jgi:hypothetical protein
LVILCTVLQALAILRERPSCGRVPRDRCPAFLHSAMTDATVLSAQRFLHLSLVDSAEPSRPRTLLFGSFLSPCGSSCTPLSAHHLSDHLLPCLPVTSDLGPPGRVPSLPPLVPPVPPGFSLSALQCCHLRASRTPRPPALLYSSLQSFLDHRC